VTGIVLAGGHSSRFTSGVPGSKLDADLLGRTVLDRSLDAVIAIAANVLVVGRASGARLDVRYIADAGAFEGPLAGILAGLGVAPTSAVVVIGGDAPLTSPHVLSLLVERLAAARSADAVALADRDDWRPLPLALDGDAARPALATAFAAGERSIRRALRGLRLAVVPEHEWRALDPGGDSLLDIDTPDDLALAARRLNRGEMLTP
jgi:molybdopterin-guanine dinucleotide biosynthesis protein A